MVIASAIWPFAYFLLHFHPCAINVFKNVGCEAIRIQLFNASCISRIKAPAAKPPVTFSPRRKFMSETMPDDLTLPREYARRNSAATFTALGSRRANPG
jgi:hypothetical protein